MRGDEGAAFLADFAALKQAVEDSPEKLASSWRDRGEIQSLCDRLDGYRRSFEAGEEWTPVPFTAHVPAGASRARREYDERWRSVVANIADRDLLDLLAGLMSSFEIETSDPTGDPLAVNIEDWKARATEDASNVRYAFTALADRRAQDEYDDFDWVDDSVRSWDRLMGAVGLDLHGAFWRRRAIPHILFPTHVSNQYGGRQISIYRRLLDAGRAFTFGAPLAALAMQRAVLEELLKRHWGSDRGHIRDADLPTNMHDARAERLKRIANIALHKNPDNLAGDELDREIIKNFLLLRELIEASPE
ncbi:MAG: hypothetical protein KAY22_21100 [Rhizorhabdus sp.]|uniref:hypothetical protein n=1 Tax=Rhizorhabdus sp. TaxID=1968843 RepID=UPI001B451D85|nr:hypothetical protein [Rhizorhabdus sp.]MBP8234794.1 hypothetical protein [Rhizorhabdus sp.]